MEPTLTKEDLGLQGLEEEPLHGMSRVLTGYTWST